MKDDLKRVERGRLDSILSRMNRDLTEDEAMPTSAKNVGVFDLVKGSEYVGEAIGVSFDKIKVQISDFFRKKAGGIPAQCFLIATRIGSDDDSRHSFKDYDDEDCAVVLLRVSGTASLPGDQDKERVLAENAERSHGAPTHWDESLSDPSLKRMMGFGAVECRVLGTFWMEETAAGWSMRFGSDLSNFYPNRGLKIYKPMGEALEAIVNFGLDSSASVRVGRIRYSSADRGMSKEAATFLDPRDLVSQKTAVFGMTRTGKSNTVKAIAKSIYLLRQKTGKRIGQIIFDANGEYANENVQDAGADGEAQALRNVWKTRCRGEMGSPDDVVVYGLVGRKGDPERKLMKMDFYDDSLLQTGKSLIDSSLLSDSGTLSQYVKSFAGVEFESLDGASPSEATRERRRRLIYKTILSMSGFKDGTGGKASKDSRSLFGADLLDSLRRGIKDYGELSESRQKDLRKSLDAYVAAASILEKYDKEGASYSELARAFEALGDFARDPNSTYSDFERRHSSSSEGGANWLDVSTSSLLEAFRYRNSFKKISKASVYHDPKSAKRDYASMIYEDLANGRLVIVDQALGDSEMNKSAAERILRRMFDENSKVFADGQKPSEMLIYVEEAHNLMPKGSEEDATNVWARTAKEGAKFNIGMVYSTQEVSSIQRNILKNTSNWFISHLNNREEIRALSDFYDFADFAVSILQSEDKGFVRMKTKSNKFVVPIQADKFSIGESDG